MYIRSLSLQSFRNFQQKNIPITENITPIVGANGAGKSNILEALSLLTNNTLYNLDWDQLPCHGSPHFFISYTTNENDIFAISFDEDTKTKKYFINHTSV